MAKKVMVFIGLGIGDNARMFEEERLNFLLSAPTEGGKGQNEAAKARRRVKTAELQDTS